MKSITLLLTVVLGLSACQAQKVLNVMTPRGGYELSTNLLYDAERSLKTDVYTPEGAQALPVVVFFYGGRWQTGDKELYRFVGQALSSRGIVTVIPNIRQFPQVLFPEFVDDAARSLAWVTENIRHYGGDPERIVLMGHSSGAHVAALLALDRRYMRQYAPRSRIHGMIGLAGPYDFLPAVDADLQRLFAPAEPAEISQPIALVRADAPPMLLMHGDADRTVQIGNSQRFAAAIRDVGGAVDLLEYPKMDHGRLLGALSAPLRMLGDVLAEIDAFVHRQVGSGKLNS